MPIPWISVSLLNHGDVLSQYLRWWGNLYGVWIPRRVSALWCRSGSSHAIYIAALYFNINLRTFPFLLLVSLVELASIGV